MSDASLTKIQPVQLRIFRRSPVHLPEPMNSVMSVPCPIQQGARFRAQSDDRPPRTVFVNKQSVVSVRDQSRKVSLFCIV